MSHLRILEFTENIDDQSRTAWVLERLRCHARSSPSRLQGLGRPEIFHYLPDTLADSIPFIRSLVGLRAVAAKYSFGIEAWTADRRTERFVDRTRPPDGISTLELGGTIVALFARQARLAVLLRRFPGLTQLSIASTNGIRVDGRCPVKLAEALRGRGKPLPELVFVGEPPFELEEWRDKMEAAGVGSVTRVAADGGSEEEEGKDECHY
ncbi:uncharacterized protein BXZ73DRAFT_106014 [Epithele typhae]|uniref:uncharacterized protein n=1 Tax=Epithele typhae TaxID=378194 RepID=UPI0020089199|nr:uncharacterized protein BXZ73DRAFT_106014 [Epithele typhae]KAH9915948.1 hypothetical protein BXZ73DRAFT_106014 [Epithele typhae]